MTKEYIENNLLTKKGTLNSNKVKHLDYTNEELYNIYHTIKEEDTICKSCGTKKFFRSFVKGYDDCKNIKCDIWKQSHIIIKEEEIKICKECKIEFTTKSNHTMCPKCNKQQRKNKSLNAECVSTHILNNKIQELLDDDIRTDGWMNKFKAEKEFYNTVYQYKEFYNIKGFVETCYLIHNNVEIPLCECGNKNKFKSFYAGYTGSCSSKCARTSEIKALNCSKTKTEKKIKRNIGKHSYMNPLYDNFYQAKVSFDNSKFKQKYKTLENFDSIIPFYDFENPENFNNRVYYYENDITEQEKCLYCGEPKTNPFSKFCSKSCSSNYYNFLPYEKIVTQKLIDSECELMSSLKDDKILIKCKCGTIQEHHRQIIGYEHTPVICYDCRERVPTQNSRFEIEINDKYPMFKHAKRILGRKDIDLLYENVGIEFNGLMWHSHGISKYSMFDYPVDKRYKHSSKTDEALEKGIELLTIFENEFIDENKKDIWFSVIENKLNLIENKIYARKCIIKEVDSITSNKFLEDNHLQGKTNALVKLGLYYENELVSLMTFGKSRFNKNIEWELIRFCNKKYTSVIGAASKLLKYFERNYNPESIISYANRRWSQGNLYNTLGFEFQDNTEPNYFYFKEGSYELESRIKYQKHKLKDILDDFEPDLSETMNMYNNGYRKIYDCGNKVYTKHYKGIK